MRKYVSLLLAFVLLIALAVPAAAAEAPKFKTYKLEELPIAVSLPEDYGCFTMATDPKDPMFAKYNRDGMKVLKWMVENSIFMNGISPDGKSEFQLSISINEKLADETDFYEMDEDVLMEIAEEYKGSVSKEEKVLDYGTYLSDQLNYIYLIYDYNKLHYVEFYTFSNIEDDAAQIRLYFASSNPIDEKTLDMVFEVANNLNLAYYPVLYWDEDGKALMAAPEGCYSYPQMVDGKDVKFAVRLPEGSFGYMTYTSEKAGKEVGDLTKISAKDFAKVNNFPADQVDEETYNGQRYLISHVQDTVKIDKKDAKIDVFNFFTTYDGMLYMIQYYENNAEQGKNIDAFEEFMESIEFDVE